MCLEKHIYVFIFFQRQCTMSVSPNRASVFLNRVPVSSKQSLAITKKDFCLHQTEFLFQPNRASLWCLILLLLFFMGFCLKPALEYIKKLVNFCFFFHHCHPCLSSCILLCYQCMTMFHLGFQTTCF